VALGLLCLGALILGYQNHRLGRRVADLEEQLAAADSSPRGKGRPGRGGRDLERIEAVDADGEMLVATGDRRRGAGRGGRGRSGVDLDTDAGGDTPSVDELMEDPAFQDRLTELVAEHASQERAERNERRREYMSDRIGEHLSEFALEHDLDEDVEAQMIQIVLDSMHQRMDLRDAMMEGEGDRDQLRAEQDRVEAESDAALVELLGQELFDELEGQWPGPGPRRR